MKIYTREELESKVPSITVQVEGEYIARIDERRRTVRRYSIELELPQSFNNSNVKNRVPEILSEHKDYEDFMSMRTFYVVSEPKPTGRKPILRTLLSRAQISRNDRNRERALREQKKDHAMQREQISIGVAMDNSENLDERGLPPVIGM